MTKVLVTGGAGFLGSVLCEHLLDAGYDVTVLDNLMYGQTGPLHLASNTRFHFIVADILDYEFNRYIPEADIIIPLAALVGAPICQSTPIEDVWDLNYGYIYDLAHFVRDDQLIIFPNTNSGYGSNQGNICIEDTPLNPISEYGKSKSEAEEVLFSEVDKAIVLRLATVFGVSSRMRTDLLVNDFVYKAITDGYLVLFEPHFRRNFIHIRDVADCFIHCIENADSMVGRAYNVGNDDLNMTKNQLALEIDNHIPIRILYDDLGVDPDKRDYIVSNQRLREAGFVASRGLDDGIQELIKGYKMTPRGMYRNA